ncbi:MAG: DNA translocase FtsK 4TM domain-containing protein [Patescibacteria group bacterium]|nr:DNA translocase FtsK 4TM domain-containing protein [Patescibacteria group bacterium]
MSRRRKKRSYNNLSFGFSRIEIDDWIKKDVIAIFLFVLALLSILSFVNLAGGLGEKLNGIINILFGWGAVLFPFALILWGWKMLKSESIFESRVSVFGIIIMVFSALSFMHIFYDPAAMFEIAKAGGGGGILGAILAWALVSLAGKWGGLIIISALLLISFLLIFDIAFIDLLGKIKFKRKTNKLNLDKKNREKNGVENEVEDEEDDEYEDEEENDKGEDDDNIKINIVGKSKEKKEGILSSLAKKIGKNKKEPKFSIKTIEDESDISEENDSEDDREEIESVEDEFVNDMDKSKQKAKDWKVPPLSLLNGKDSEPTSGDIKVNSNIIKRTLANFGIEVEMGEVNVGPTVTQYTLKPAVGIKLSRITTLQNDLALALAARSLRIEAPIPGKSWIGLELPNQSVAMVGLKNILSSTEFYNKKSNLSVVLGRDVAGNAIFANLEKMPHLMIAGSTGSGKTVCVNTLIASLLFQNSPEMLRFIMVDPKRVELTPYNDIPHLLTPVITDPDKAVNSLKWSISEMEKRYETLSHLGCRNIESYNQAVRTKYKQREILPYLVIVIDELADLMATHGREVETAIVRLAQMARAVGIHLVLSTQRPSVEVITGLIKANITTRIAFQVASQIDSRTILDMSGAEKLLGSGDMLYLSRDSNKPKRIQGVFISEKEIQTIVSFLKDQKEEEIEYDEEITESKKSSLEFNGEESGNDADDDLYDDAVEAVKVAEKASATLLQRRLKIGYSRAARLLDTMEDKGIIGPSNGAKPREVYGTGEGVDDGEEKE